MVLGVTGKVLHGCVRMPEVLVSYGQWVFAGVPFRTEGGLVFVTTELRADSLSYRVAV